MNQHVTAIKAWAETLYSIMHDTFVDMPLYGWFFWAIPLFCLLSWIVLRKKVKRGSPRLLSPLIPLVAYAAYEATNPPDWDIRIDLFPILLFLLPTVVLAVKRLRHPINENGA